MSSSRRKQSGSPQPVVGMAYNPVTGLYEDNIHNVLLKSGEQASRGGFALRQFINGLNGIGANEVLTTAQIVYNVPAARRVFVSQMSMQLATINDIIQVDIGWTTVVNGAGAFTPVTVQHVLQTGGAIAPNTGQIYTYYPLLLFEYSAGVRSITLRVDANDVAATMNLMWAGWWEAV